MSDAVDKHTNLNQSDIFRWGAFVAVSSAIHWWIDDGKRLNEDSVIVRFH
jgi:hypothetical protein